MNEFLLHISTITILVWLTYSYIIWKCSFVIDDIEGIVNYDGKVPPDAYYGDYMKWLRFKVADKSPMHHHFFSVILKNASCIMLYLFLSTIINPYIAWLVCLLFAVTPMGTQAVAWISGIGYLIGLFFGLIGLLVPYMNIPNAWGLSTLLYALCSVLAIIGNFTMLTMVIITLFLGNSPYVLLGVLISIAMGIQIVKKTIKLRAGVFKAQNMGASTHFKWQKFIVATKSLLYYTILALFPAKMGLYHTWGFHYEPAIEKEDNMFWLGVLLLAGFGALFYFGDFAIKFGVVWYLSFIFIFLNWITIHQFVSERYCYIASIGLWIIMAKFLAPYPLAFAFILGLYLMRTWQHLPTYQNEITFYQSNIWNFPKSEVALANLGATYMKAGLGGAASDMWNIAIRTNPKYDVPYYNLYALLRSQKQWAIARNFLVKAVEAPTCHFKDTWTQELVGFDKEVAYDNILMSFVSRKDWESAKKLIIDTLANQTQNPIYLEKIHADVFKNRLQAELKQVEAELSKQKL